MTSRATEIKVGITVTAALVALVAGTAWMAQLRLDRDGYEITARFDEVGGLEAGDPVLVSGVEVGRVKQVALRPPGVETRLWIAAGTRLSRDTEFSIANMGLMGERFVAVRPGTAAALLQAGDEVSGRYAPAPTEVTGSVEETIEAVGDLARRLELLLGERPEGDVGALVEDAGAATRELGATIGENRSDLREAVRNLTLASRDLRAFTAGNGPRIEEAVERLSRTAGVLEEMVDRLDRASRPLAETARRVEAGEGSLGKMVADDSLYFELRRAVRNLDSLVVDARKNPKRYFTVEIF